MDEIQLFFCERCGGGGDGGYCNKKTGQLVKQGELSPCLLTDEMELMFERKELT